MKKIVVVLAIFAMAIWAASGTVLAQGQGGGGRGGGDSSGSSSQDSEIGDQDQIRDRDRIQDPTTHDGDEPIQDRDRDQIRDRDRLQDETLDRDQLQTQDKDRDRIRIKLEATSTSASTSAQLRQMIRERERELEREASTTEERHQNVIRNENQVRLAVHALLASENMLGGLGPEVSQIARQINASVEESVNAELRINNRNFLTRFFIGGDKDAGQALLQEANLNKNRIKEIKELINQSTNAELRLELERWLKLVEQEQERIQEVADKAIKEGGFFSWRF